MLAARFRNRLKAVPLPSQPAIRAQNPLLASGDRNGWLTSKRSAMASRFSNTWAPTFTALPSVPKSILADDGQSITFAWRDNQKRQRTTRLKAEAFLHRYLQHVLPKGLQRVRYYGWLSPAATKRWERILALLDCKEPALKLPAPLPPPQCPVCHRPMIFVARLPRAPPG